MRRAIVLRDSSAQRVIRDCQLIRAVLVRVRCAHAIVEVPREPVDRVTSQARQVALGVVFQQDRIDGRQFVHVVVAA